MQPVTPQVDQNPRRDPAPSRWSYRYERLMLTPLYRRLFRVGPPLAFVALAVAIFAASEDRRNMVVDAYDTAVLTIQNRPEFMLNAMAIDGVDEPMADTIRTVLPLSFPVSSFDVDLDLLRETVEAVNGVQDATLRVKQGGILEVAVVPRVPVAIWRRNEGLALIDAEGHFVGPLAARSDRLDLPLIAGDGAEEAILEALTLHRAAGPIADRIRGMVRMGERRWDVVLDRQQRILLPTQDPVTALERVVVMAQTQDLLERDVAVVDMRDEARPTLRLGEQAAAEMRRINAAVSGAGQ